MRYLKLALLSLPFFVLSCIQENPEGGSDNQIMAEISATPDNIEYNPSDANANVIEVVSTVSWSAAVSDVDLKLSKLSGPSGTTPVTILGAPKERPPQ